MKYIKVWVPLLVMTLVASCKTINNQKNQVTGDHIGQSIISLDSTVNIILGDSISLFLFSPDSVTVSKLVEKIESTRFSKSKSFKKSSIPKTIKGIDLQILQQKFLSNKQNYQKDSIVVMSPFIPAMEIDFFKNQDAVNMIISFSDHSWVINKNGQTIINFNYVTEEPLSIIYNNM